MSQAFATPTDLPGVLLVVPARFRDARGDFCETYREDRFREAGIEARFVQDNHARSREAGTVRGLHFQAPPHAQAKLVRVVRGRVFDVAVDIRTGSPTYGRWTARELTAEGGEQLFVPRGFAHGYCTLEPGTEVAYKVDGYYAPASDRGLLWSDPGLAIPWPVAPGDALLSDKDRSLPALSDLASPFTFGADL
jgi:dTDP-4-dehydrorhamnose 3,5-epimerase